jgi:hypothetical protein
VVVVMVGVISREVVVVMAEIIVARTSPWPTPVTTIRAIWCGSEIFQEVRFGRHNLLLLLKKDMRCKER